MKSKSFLRSMPALSGIFLLLFTLPSPMAPAQPATTAADIDTILNDLVINGTYNGSGSFTGVDSVIAGIYDTGTTNAALIASSSAALVTGYTGLVGSASTTLQAGIDANTALVGSASAALVSDYTILVATSSVALQAGITTNADAITTLTSTLNTLITYDAAGNGTLNLGPGVVADTVNIGRTPGTTRKLTGLTAGAVAAGSTDAINGDQFFALSGTVGTFGGTIAAIGSDLYNPASGLTATYNLANTTATTLTLVTSTLNSEVARLDTAISSTAGVIDTRITNEVGALNSTIASASTALNTALTSATTALGTSIDTLGTALTSATTALDTRITTEVAALNSTISATTTAIDTRITNEVGTLNTTIASASTALNTALTSATTALGTSIDTLGTTLTTATTALGNSITTEVAALNSTISATTAAIDTRITTEVAALNSTIATATTALGARIDGVQLDLDALDSTAVKYVNSADPIINLRAGTTINNVAAITGLADVTAGDSDQTKAVNIASAKTIATDIAATISGSLINEANKSIAFSAGNTGAAIGLGATDAMALGSAAVANASNAIALGAGARVSDQAPGSIALGSAATANHANSVALGANTTTGEADTIAAGSRTLSQVAAKDLTAANAGYAATTGQLYNTGSTLAATLGGGATLAADGAISGWNVTLASGAAGPANYTNVADALTGLDQNLNDRIDGVISNHNADLAALDQKLDGEIATRENLITTQVRTNGIASVTDARGDDIVDIRLGNGSLVTSRHAINAPDGNGYIYEQQLFARDAGGAAININIANGSKLLVDGDEVIGKNAVQARIDAAETRVNDRIADLQTQINGLRNYDADPLMLGIRANAAAIQKLARGIAMTAALQTPQIAPGHRRAVKFGMAYYDDQTGLAGGYAERLNENVSINAEMATGYQFKEVIVRGGINYSW